MKHDCCRNCRFYWEPDCHRYMIPIRVYTPSRNYCEEYEPEDKEEKEEKK